MRTLLTKTLRLIVVLLLVTMVSFVLLSLLPGDPASNFSGIGANKAQLAQIRHDMHLTDPLPVRYGHWLWDFVHGNMGKYYGLKSNNPAQIVRTKLPLSLQLMLYVQLFSLLIAIPLGVFTAYKADTVFDKGISLVASLAISIPSFILAYLFKQWFAIGLHWFPESGWVTLSAGGLVQHLKSVALPVIVLSLAQIGIYQRLLRSDMIATLQEDFITMAKSKGLKPRRILFRHALRPSSLTLLTVAGLSVGTLIGGALIVEVIFHIPGFGTAIYEAIQAREYVAFQSFIAIVAILYVLINFAVDFLYTILDPRIRHV